MKGRKGAKKRSAAKAPRANNQVTIEEARAAGWRVPQEEQQGQGGAAAGGPAGSLKKMKASKKLQLKAATLVASHGSEILKTAHGQDTIKRIKLMQYKERKQADRGHDRPNRKPARSTKKKAALM
eukprot:g130.t1